MSNEKTPDHKAFFPYTGMWGPFVALSVRNIPLFLSRADFCSGWVWAHTVNTPRLQTMQCTASVLHQKSIFHFFYKWQVPSLKAGTHFLQMQSHVFSSMQLVCKCSKSQAGKPQCSSCSLADGFKCFYIRFFLAIRRSDPTSDVTLTVTPAAGVTL